ncbi:MAG: hypothetical protein EOP52_04020 [Sphingobacteriales bacterium]|nr:MAG: hypothetical protein EOP52_04020 [Sphingobacteriales bacterium]
MKKIVLALGLMAVSAMSYQAQAAIKLFGFEVSFEKGSKEWNADRTSAECIGKGLCKISVRADALSFKGNIGIDDEGRVIFVPGTEFNKSFPKELASGSYPVSELKFQANELSSIGIRESLVIPTGNYPTRYDKDRNIWYVILN